ncbi:MULTISPECIES: hypothetical protein [unclassified Aquimarina]|nr:hypothetical protein [Aquimarina sp. 2201CG14-23]MDH7445876.1 hypothetical protein [Aquimarina sp. 2201CG14-23]
MAKFYFKSSRKEEQQQLVPKKITVDFLLNYSKALSVIDYKNMKFEALLN